MAAVAAPFVLVSLFPIVDAFPLERRGNSTASRGFDGATQFGPWTVPFWAYILIIGLITSASITILVFLVKFLLSISCWTLRSSVDTLLAEKAAQRQEKQAHQTHTENLQLQPQPLQHQRTRESHDSLIHGAITGFNDHSHIRTYSTHSNGGAYVVNQAGAGNIAPYHQYTLPRLPSAVEPHPQRHQQRYYHLKHTGPETFAFPLVPASMLSRASSRPSSELDLVVPYPPPGLEHKYSASH